MSINRILQLLSFIITSGGIALLISCASQPQKPDQPDWVSGVSQRYPNVLYLTGRGTADKLTLAEDRARGALAKTLEVEIDQHSKDVQTFSTSQQGDQIQTNRSLNIIRRIAISTKKVVRGIEIADIWRDETGMHHVLAVLSRNQAAMGLRNDIDGKDQTTQLYLEKAKNAIDPLAKITYLDQALQVQLPRVALQRTLQVIDKTGVGVASKYNTGKIRVALTQTLADIKLKPKALGNHANAISPMLAGSVSKAGFTETQQETQADFILEALLEVDDLGNKEGWYWLKGTLSVNLVDQVGNSRGNQRWTLKESARDKMIAKRRLFAKVANKLNASLRDTIISFAKRD